MRRLRASLEGLTDGTGVPQTVVHSSQTPAVLGVAKLGQEHRRGDLGQAVAGSHQDTTAHEDWQSRGETLNKRSSDHDEAPDDDWDLAAKVVGKKRTFAVLGAKDDFRYRSSAHLDTYTNRMDTMLPIW